MVETALLADTKDDIAVSSYSTTSVASIYMARGRGTAATPVTASTRDSSMRFYTALDGTNAEKMRIDSSGNVGIATTAAGTKLAVNGNTVLGGVTAATGAASTDTTILGDTFFGTSGSWKVNSGGTGSFGYLSVNAPVSTGAQLDTIAASATTIGLRIKAAASQTSDLMQVQNSGATTVASINAGGGGFFQNDVGVGTSSPAPTAVWTGGKNLNIYGAMPNLRLSGVGVSDFTIGSDSNGGHIWNTSALPVMFYTSASEQMRIGATGEVSIGNTATTQKLNVEGNIRLGITASNNGCVKSGTNATITGTCSSDIRFKKNIVPAQDMLDKITKLEVVNYDWRVNEFPEQGWGSERQLGFIAQQIEAVMPELVETDGKGFKAVHYELIPMLALQAVRELYIKWKSDHLLIQEQARQMASLKTEKADKIQVNQLKAENDKLK